MSRGRPAFGRALSYVSRTLKAVARYRLVADASVLTASEFVIRATQGVNLTLLLVFS